jgi:hypothetical protein
LPEYRTVCTADLLFFCLLFQAKNGLREADIEAILKKIPVKLGAGKKQVP